MAKHNIQLDARSLIRIYPIINKLDPFILKHVDWVFFASRNGIDHFFSLDPQLRKHTRIGVVGRGSEEALRKYDRVADFSGDDFGIHTDEIGLEFAKIANGQTVLFPRAKDSLETIQKAMSADTKIIDMPVYETVLDENVAATTAEVLIFTSPSNVEAYFIDNLIEPGQQIISIGKSTGAKIAEMGLPYVTPYSPDEIGLTEAVFGLKY